MRGDVGARRIDHLAEVAERQIANQRPAVVDVERGPAAVRALHPLQPPQPALHRAFGPPARVARHGAQRQQHLGRVVDVRVVDVGELERPAAGLELGYADRPVAALADLLAEQPVGAPRHRLVITGHARVVQRDQRQRRIPHRRLARLQPAHAVLGDRESLEPFEAPLHHGVVERIAEQVQGDQRVHPWRLDPAPPPVGLLTLDDPPLRARQRRLPERPHRTARVQVQHPIERHQPAHGRRAAARRRPWLGSAQLLQPERERTLRAVRQHDGESDDRLAGPAGEVVHVQREPRGQEDHLRRQRRDALPRPRAEHREPDVREHARLLDAARCADELGRGAHVRLARLVTGQPQRDVRLDRRRQIAGPAPEVAPRAVRPLLRADPRSPSARSPAPRECPGTAAAACPRRPSSRSSRARPSTSRPGPGARADARGHGSARPPRGFRTAETSRPHRGSSSPHMRGS